MAEVEQLLRDFVAAFEADGEANPRTYLDQLEGVDRSELEVLIDAYLERAPAREWDPEAFERSGGRELADRLHASLVGGGGLWPTLLPRLRNRAKLKRGELVARLASELGVEDRTEKVRDYYHEMESGLLPSEGVSDQVLDALAGALGSTREALRRRARACRGRGPRRGADRGMGRGRSALPGP